ncbi:MAG: PAS domain S-box protein [Polyangiaceae bacterium]
MPARDLISAPAEDPLSQLSSSHPLLVVDDNDGDLVLICEQLFELGVRSESVIKASDLSQTLQLLRSRRVRIVLLDLGLPDAQGVEGVEGILAEYQVPIVVLTGRNDHAQALKCIQAGAQDYLPKDNLELDALRRAIAYAMTRAQMEDARRRATAVSERLAAIVNASPDAIVSVTARGTILSWNSGAERIFGFSEAEALGGDLMELARPADAASTRVQRESLTGSAAWLAKPREIVRRRRDGSLVNLSVVGCPLFDAAGNQTGTATIARDVTEDRRRDEALVESHDALRQRAEQMRALTRRMNDLREEERTRISREVHDELGQLLTCLKLDLAWVRHHVANTGEGVAERLTQADSLVDDTITAVQKVALELRPSVLDALGLVPAMRDEARRFEARTGLRVTARVEDVSVPPLVATQLFRILQELLTNVARHARASSVELLFKEVDGEFELRVADDGLGMKAERATGIAALGLLGVRERAAALGGEIQFSKAVPSGTVVVVRVPRSGGELS